MDKCDYLRSPIMKKKIVSCFDIGEVPRSPGKWNWNLLYFLPFIFTFEQCDTVLNYVNSVCKYVFISDYTNLMTNSNWRHNADPNKANNGTDNGRAKRRHIFTKKGKLFKYLLTLR